MADLSENTERGFCPAGVHGVGGDGRMRELLLGVQERVAVEMDVSIVDTCQKTSYRHHAR